MKLVQIQVDHISFGRRLAILDPQGGFVDNQEVACTKLLAVCFVPPTFSLLGDVGIDGG
jgi:hypothetical protein